MKKLISVMSALCLTAVSSSSLISCMTNEKYIWNGNLSLLTERLWNVQSIFVDDFKHNNKDYLNEIETVLYEKLIQFTNADKRIFTSNSFLLLLMVNKNDNKTTLSDDIVSFVISHNIDASFYVNFRYSDSYQGEFKNTVSENLAFKLMVKQ